MSHAVLDYMAEIEDSSEIYENYDVGLELVNAYVCIGPDFMRDVYYEMSAHSGFRVTPDRITLESLVSSERKSLRTLVKACELLHYSLDHLNDLGVYHRPSLTMIITVISSYKDDDLVERTVFYNKWAKNKSTIALLYAASTIKVGDQVLLDKILDGEIKATDFIGVFDVWLGRARFFCDNYLSKLGIKGIEKDNAKALRFASQMPFETSFLDPREIDFLRRNFKKEQQFKSSRSAR
ncbi:hypothetical protein [Neorhizobium sp. S3-V5DH]|uniref:hypothetical protein n=1 Tax=Neorhizobium sp. S3-V5DH TaxID=2485166 RepID=UPI00104B1647|nr:hypothetical protein [Neorhizobium sp. S3-V5DH]TCV75916.1 hypothetical protein EDE09_101199 [Neorhizobium sp. S3-V5DH]